MKKIKLRLIIRMKSTSFWLHSSNTHWSCWHHHRHCLRNSSCLNCQDCQERVLVSASCWHCLLSLGWGMKPIEPLWEAHVLQGEGKNEKSAILVSLWGDGVDLLWRRGFRIWEVKKRAERPLKTTLGCATSM